MATCIILYYTILYYTILYYTILYYTILYYTNDSVIMTVDYMTMAHTMLVAINEQLINFVYSLLLLFIAYCRLCHVYILCYSEPEHSRLWPSKCA